jgi:phospholipase D1/2
MCIIDNDFGFLGGLDICLGRYDTNNHDLFDADDATDFGGYFPGLDYSNTIRKDFVKDEVNGLNKVSIDKNLSRMPWYII